MAKIIIPEKIDKPPGEIIVTNGIDKKNEYELILQSLPRHEKAICQKWYVEFSDYVTWEDYKKGGYKYLSDVVDEVKDHILKVTGKPEQLKLAFMPTEIARTSPFFPMGRAEKADRHLYKDFVIKNNWGTITVSGEKLSIQDESVLLAVLFLVKKYKKEHISTDYAELCHIMGIERGTTQYKAIEEGLSRLAKAVVETQLFDTANLKKQEVIRKITGSILSSVDQKPKSTKVNININPYFLALYGANLTTCINLEKRSQLKGDVSKALYRFLETHTGSGVPYGIATIVLAINLNADQRLCDIRKIIKKALGELQKLEIIKKWNIDKNDLVFIYR